MGKEIWQMDAGSETELQKVQQEGLAFQQPELALQSRILAKGKIYDSVFTNIFRIPEYTLQLYQVLHPEDEEMTADQIRIVTLENILLNQPYNDLGFLAGNRLMILVEQQTKWSDNIVIRSLIYMAQTIQQYIVDTKQNVYGEKKVIFPEPEIYVVFIGDSKNKPSQLSLSEVYFGGKAVALEMHVKVIFDGKEGDILNQYITFTKIYREQCKLYGRTQKAVMETIRVCKDRNVLRSYLQSREKEVVNIMMTLFDQEYAMERYTEDILLNKAKETAVNLANMGLSAEQIASAVKVSLTQVKKWLANEDVLVK